MIEEYLAAIFVLFLIVVFSFVLGGLLVTRFIQWRGSFPEDWLAFVFICVTLGVVIVGWFALVLAELGWFSIWPLGIFWLSMVLISAAAILRERRKDASDDKLLSFSWQSKSIFGTPSWLQYVLLGIWLLAASWLFFRPHEYIIGGADAGVYVNFSVNISQSGRILIDDPTLAELDVSLYPAFLRLLPSVEEASRVAPYYIMPGFYVPGNPAGRITPQFYPLHAVWQAIAHSLGDVRGALLLTGLWALLGSLAIYLVVRHIAGWEAAFVTLAGLTLNAIQVWFARYPTTEALSQYLLWSAVWAMVVWIENEKPLPLWGLVAGLALGDLFLVRIDAYFLLAIPLFIWFWLRWSGRWRRDHWWFFLPLGLLTLHSFVHAYWQSRPYFYSIFGYGVIILRQYFLIPISIIILGLIILLLMSRYRGYLERLSHYKRQIAWLAVAAIITLVVYGWFIRPNLTPADDGFVFWYGDTQIPAGINQQNLVRLGWYLSPLGILLATVGICLMILEINRQKAIILAVGLIFSLLYLWRIRANPHQIYTMRRYVPAVMPFAMVASGYLFGWLFHQKRILLKVFGLVLAIAWLVALGWTGQDFIKQVDHTGLIAQLDALDQQLAANSILIFNDQRAITAGDTIGTPLRFLYGHDVYSLRDHEALDDVAFRSILQGWLDAGRSIYFIGDPKPIEELGIPTSEPFSVIVQSQQLEGRYDIKPSELVYPKWEMFITPLE